MDALNDFTSLSEFDNNFNFDDDEGYFDNNDTEEAPLQFSSSELKDLFDFSTVKSENLFQRSFLRSREVGIPKYILTSDGVEESEERIFSLYEDFDRRTQTLSERIGTLPIVKGCSRDNNTVPTMPSLRVELLDKSYSEPKRSREKNWVLDSQREILNYEPPSNILAMGTYVPETLSNLEWHSKYSDLLRKKCLLRRIVMVSDTLAVIQINGLGIAGRLVANGGITKRMLIIEAYSVWNSTKYYLEISIAQLKYLFIEYPHLLEPGKKILLLEEVMKRLYFDYTLNIPPLPEEDPKTVRIVKISHLEDLKNIPDIYPQKIIDIIDSYATARKLDEKPPLIGLEQELKISILLRENGAQKRAREEAERLRREREEEEARRRAWLAIPRRIRGMTYCHATRQQGKLIVLASYVFPMRRNVAPIRAHFYQECAKTNLSITLTSIGPIFKIFSNPKGWKEDTIKYLCKSMVLETTLIGSHSPIELMLIMRGRRGASVELLPYKSIQGFEKRIIRKSRSRKVNLKEVFLEEFIPPLPPTSSQLKETTAENTTSKVSESLREIKSIEKSSPIIIQSDDSPNVVSDSLVNNGLEANNVVSMEEKDVDLKEEVLGALQLEAGVIDSLGVTSTSNSVSTSSLGVVSDRRQAWLPALRCRPRREIGHGQRACTRVINIQGVRSICTLYFTNVANNKFFRRQQSNNPFAASLKVADTSSKIKGQEDTATIGTKTVSSSEVDWDLQDDRPKHEIESLGLFLSVEIDIYIPIGTKNILGKLLPNNCHFRMKLHRFDIIRLVEDKDLLATALRAADKDFYDYAMYEDVIAAEIAWSKILEIIISNIRWTIPKQPSIINKLLIEEAVKNLPNFEWNRVRAMSYDDKAVLAEKLLYIDTELINTPLVMNHSLPENISNLANQHTDSPSKHAKSIDAFEDDDSDAEQRSDEKLSSVITATDEIVPLQQLSEVAPDAIKATTATETNAMPLPTLPFASSLSSASSAQEAQSERGVAEANVEEKSGALGQRVPDPQSEALVEVEEKTGTEDAAAKENSTVGPEQGGVQPSTPRADVAADEDVLVISVPFADNETAGAAADSKSGTEGDASVSVAVMTYFSAKDEERRLSTSKPVTSTSTNNASAGLSVSPDTATSTSQYRPREPCPLVLRLSTTRTRKILLTPSEAPNRPFPLMPVTLWQRGQSFGAIGFDRERNDIYFAQQSAKQQKTFLESLISLQLEELVINVTLLMADIAYYEAPLDGQQHTVLGAIKFIDNNNLNLNVVDKDYKTRTDKATNKAAEAAKVRAHATAGLLKSDNKGGDSEDIATSKFFTSGGIADDMSAGQEDDMFAEDEEL